MRANFHAHTCFSFDGCPEATVTAMCESAIEKGLSLIALTDHCDINGEIEGIYPVLDKKGVFAAVSEAKEKYADRLTVLFGVELGQATQYPAEARALLQKYPYDIVLGSLHNLANNPDFYYMSQPVAEFPAPQLSEMTAGEINALFARVLEETMELLDFDGIHVLTHLTYMHRYVRRVGKEMDFSVFTPALTALFQKMIRRDVALELNASTLYREGVTMPTPELIALYRRVGGRLISLGSDAHHPDRVTFGFDRAASILLDCGFTELAVPTAHGILTSPIKP